MGKLVFILLLAVSFAAHAQSPNLNINKVTPGPPKPRAPETVAAAVQAAAPEPIPQAPQPVVGRASLPMPLEDAADDERLEDAVGRGGRDAERIHDVTIADHAAAVGQRPDIVGVDGHEAIVSKSPQLVEVIYYQSPHTRLS